MRAYKTDANGNYYGEANTYGKNYVGDTKEAGVGRDVGNKMKSGDHSRPARPTPALLGAGGVGVPRSNFLCPVSAGPLESAPLSEV